MIISSLNKLSNLIYNNVYDNILLNMEDFDMVYITGLLQEVDQTEGIGPKHNIVLDIFEYIIRFPYFFIENPKFARAARCKAIEIRNEVNDYVADCIITFELGANITQLATQIVEFTEFVSDFDYLPEQRTLATELSPIIVNEEEEKEEELEY